MPAWLLLETGWNLEGSSLGCQSKPDRPTNRQTDDGGDDNEGEDGTLCDSTASFDLIMCHFPLFELSSFGLCLVVSFLYGERTMRLCIVILSTSDRAKLGDTNTPLHRA